MIALVTFLNLALSANQALAAHELNLPPNEMGQVMVLMYHQIKAPGTTISPKDVYSTNATLFRENLEKLYGEGYYLINVRDLIDGTINVPLGKTPVALTFDDGAPGQFTKINGSWDPNSAVGIINDIYEKHPDFGRAGSFYLNELGEKKHPDIKATLQEMVTLGFELGNHTVDHPELNKLDQTGTEKEIANLQAWIDSLVPGYHVRTMALPFGIYPKETSWAEDGEYNNVKYHHEALLAVGAEPSVSPYSKAFRPMHIARVRASDPEWFNRYVELFERSPSLRFVSDGDPKLVTVPESKKSQLRTDLPSALHVFIRQ
jgi:peptidoglycan/xylan/chitin deacetylase (PgdA/CDA1 family)